MSLTAAAIRMLAEKGLSGADIADVAEANEAARSTGAERQRRYRDRLKDRDVTRDVTDERNESDASSRTRVVNPSSSSLRSEEGKNPIPSNEGIDPLKAKTPALAKPNGFARFWEAYPNKVAKVAAEKAYAKALKAIPGPDPPSVILAGVERAKASRQWREGFIPHPATWLNRGSWDDEPAETTPQTPRQAHERPDLDRRFTARQENYARAFAGSELAALRRGSG
jgi:hypothetical protein